MTADVVAFLRAALDEVERVALATRSKTSKPAQWVSDPWYDGTGERADVRDVPLGPLSSHGALEATTVEHIALHDPRAALARVQAERFILELHEGSHECSSWNEMHREYDNCCWIVDGGCSTVYALALRHRYTVPGFDSAWAPEGVSADA